MEYEHLKNSCKCSSVNRNIAHCTALLYKWAFIAACERLWIRSSAMAKVITIFSPVTSGINVGYLTLLLNYNPHHLCRGVYSFCLSICVFVKFVCLSRLWNLPQSFTTKFHNKVGFISTTTHQKTFILVPWVHWRVCFHAISIGPSVHAPG